jgi:hypothetical protein
MAPYDSGGNFSLVPSYLAVTGQVVQPVQHNPPFEDIASSGLSNVLVRDGRAPMTGNLNMGTFKLTNLAAGTLSSDAVNKGQLAWQLIEKRTFSGVTGIAFTNLGAYSSLRLTGRIIVSANGTVGWRSSTDNGVTYAAGASDYSFQGNAFNDTVVTTGRTAASSFGIISAGLQVTVNAIFNDFNFSGNGCYCTNTSSVSLASGITTRVDSSIRADTTARNALQILQTAAVTLTGYLTIEGMV